MRGKPRVERPRFEKKRVFSTAAEKKGKAAARLQKKAAAAVKRWG
jgi:hypothetical protein